MKTEMSERLTVVCNRALVKANKFNLPKLEQSVNEILAMRVSLNRKGRGEGVEILRAEMSRETFVNPMMGPAPAITPQQIQSQNPSSKNWLDKLRGR